MSLEAPLAHDEVFAFDPKNPSSAVADRNKPSVLWAPPGSLFIDGVRRAWERRAETRDLADVSGPWAVALWSPIEGFVLATDPMGVQPLYWARTSNGQIAAASWLARLVERSDVDDAFDYEGILLTSSHRLRTDTFAHRTGFSSVTLLPWGRAAIFDPSSQARLIRYWDPRLLPEPDRNLSLADCSAILRETVDDAIRRLLPDSELPIGAHVSGGLDCTSIACRTHDILRTSGSGLRAAYSWSPDEREVPRFTGDERGLLEEVSELLGLPISPVYADESGDWFLERDPNLYPDSTHMRERFVLPKAHNDGVRMMFSGWGGDELASFNGRGVPSELVRDGKWATLWKLMRDRRHIMTGNPPSLAMVSKSFLRQLVAMAPEPIANLRHPRAALTARRDRIALEKVLREWSPDIADAFREYEENFDSIHDHRQYQIALLMNGHLPHRTNGWYQTGRLFDIEYRYPLLDKNVVEAALTMPWHAFFSQGWDRVAYRLAIEPWVPASVTWNPTKYEPAHFWPIEKRAIPRSTPEPEAFVPDDPKYREVLALAEKLRPTGLNRIPETARVRPRPEFAVRI